MATPPPNTLPIRFLNPSTKQVEPCNVPRNITIKELVFHLVKEYSLDSVHIEHMILSIAATTSTESVTLNNDAKVEEQLASFRQDKDVLEMLRRPLMLTVVYSENGTTPSELRRILVEIGQPLNNNFGRFRRCFGQLQNTDYIFQAVVPGEKPEFLNSNKCLRDYGFDATSQRTKSLQLTLLPVQTVVRRWKDLNEPIAKRGWLNRQSGPDMEKISSKRERRYFVLTRTFLAYFKNESDSTPERVIPLDFHILKRYKNETNPNLVSICLRRVTKYFQITTKSAMSAVTGISTDGTASEVAGRITSTMVGTLRNVVKPTPNVYLLSNDAQTEEPEWFMALEEKCINTGDRKVFGVDLADALSRRSRGSIDTSMMIPTVISKCTAALDLHGLDYEGIFRLSGRASTVEMYKDEFDLGEDVDLSTCDDPHSVAALLKSYLRMLPEPLLTFDLYQPFLDAASKKGATAEQRAAEVSKVCGQLPLENKLVMRYLLTFFKRVISLSHLNKMTSNNLAICMGTNLLRSRDADSPAAVARSITETPVINEVVQLMIDYESKMNLEVQMGPPQVTQPATSPMSNPRVNLGARVAPPAPSVSQVPALPPRDSPPPPVPAPGANDPNAAIAAAMRHKLSSAPAPHPSVLASSQGSAGSPKMGTNPFTPTGAPPVLPNRNKAGSPSFSQSVSAPLPKQPAPHPHPVMAPERAVSPPPAQQPKKVMLPVIPAARPANLNAPPTQVIPSDEGQLVASSSSVPPWNRASLYEGNVAVRALHKTNYSQRYCVLTAGSVYIFKSPADKDRPGIVPSGVVPLRDVELARINNKTFRLSSTNNGAGVAVVTNTDAEFDEWMTWLTNCIRTLRAITSATMTQTAQQASDAVEELRWQQTLETKKLEKRNNRNLVRIDELERALAAERARAERLEATLRLMTERMQALEQRGH